MPHTVESLEPGEIPHHTIANAKTMLCNKSGAVNTHNQQCATAGVCRMHGSPMSILAIPPSSPGQLPQLQLAGVTLKQGHPSMAVHKLIKTRDRARREAAAHPTTTGMAVIQPPQTTTQAPRIAAAKPCSSAGRMAPMTKWQHLLDAMAATAASRLVTVIRGRSRLPPASTSQAAHGAKQSRDCKDGGVREQGQFSEVLWLQRGSSQMLSRKRGKSHILQLQKNHKNHGGPHSIPTMIML